MALAPNVDLRSEKSTWLNWIFQSSIEFRRRLKDSRWLQSADMISARIFSLDQQWTCVWRFFSPNTLLIKIFVHADLHMQNNRAWFSFVSARSCVHDEKGRKKGERNTLKISFFGLQHFISFFCCLMLLCFFKLFFVRISRFLLPFRKNNLLNEEILL
jgi:hypothetical protein